MDNKVRSVTYIIYIRWSIEKNDKARTDDDYYDFEKFVVCDVSSILRN